jgi:hypothetical protein
VQALHAQLATSSYSICAAEDALLTQASQFAVVVQFWTHVTRVAQELKASHAWYCAAQEPPVSMVACWHELQSAPLPVVPPVDEVVPPVDEVVPPVDEVVPPVDEVVPPVDEVVPPVDDVVPPVDEGVLPLRTRPTQVPLHSVAQSEQTQSRTALAFRCAAAVVPFQHCC